MLIRTLRVAFGFLLLAGGVVGWILPLIPGWLMIIPGLLVLGKEFHWARRLHARLRSVVPNRWFPKRSSDDRDSSPPDPPAI